MKYRALDKWVAVYEHEKLKKTRIALITALKYIFEARFLSELSLWRLKNDEKVIISHASRLSGIWVCPFTSRLKASKVNLSRYERYLEKCVREDENGMLENERPIFADDFTVLSRVGKSKRARIRRKKLVSSIHTPVSLKFGKRILYADFRRSRRIDPKELDIFLGKCDAVDTKKHMLAKDLLYIRVRVRQLRQYYAL